MLFCAAACACGPAREPESATAEPLEPRPPTELEKKVSVASEKASRKLKRFGLDRTGLALGALPHAECADRKFELELAELIRAALLEGDTGSRIELARTHTALATCEYGADSAEATRARAAETTLLLGDGLVLEAERRYDEERAWLRKTKGAESAAEALLTENWITSLIFAGLLGPAYATFDDARPLLLRERGPETTQLLIRLAQWACLHGRPSLAASYGQEAQRQIRAQDIETGVASTLAYVAACLKEHGEQGASSRLGSWALSTQASQARKDGTPALRFARRVQLGQVQVALGKPELAAQTYEDLLTDVGPDPKPVTDPAYHAWVMSLSGLAQIQAERGQLAEARATLEPYPESGLDILGPTLDRALGRISKAEQAWQAIEDRSKGYHPSFRILWATEGARIAWAQGSAELALSRYQDALEKGRSFARQKTESGSEEDRRQAQEPLGPVVSAFVAAHLHSWRDDERFTQAALDAILFDQASVLESATEDTEVLRERDPALLVELRSAREALAKQSVATSGSSASNLYRERLALERLEAQARQTTRQFRKVRPALTSLEVQKVLGANEVLLTFFEFAAEKPDQLPRQAERHLAVYGLAQKGKPFALDLGPTRTIETKVGALRRALVPGSGGYRDAAMALGELTLRPLKRQLGTKTTLRVTPAGALNLVPLAALLDEQGEPYLERYAISYVTSARELMPQAHSNSRKTLPVKPPWIVAGPDFGGTPGAASSPFSLASRGVRSAALGSLEWQPLPGTVREGKALLSLFPKATLLQGARATEAQVKAISSPEILHIATHGYFLPGGSQNANLVTSLAEDPLLDSGLVLTGANAGGGGGEDGYLTALELASMDLSQTELTTLSACETGLGYVGGEGVHGLRRALHMAGSKSQLLSLWNVDDEATLELMMAFYERLRAGEGRAEALRNVQRAMFAGKSPAPASSKRPRSAATTKYRAPYFWAAFVLSGAAGPLASSVAPASGKK